MNRPFRATLAAFALILAACSPTVVDTTTTTAVSPTTQPTETSTTGADRPDLDTTAAQLSYGLSDGTTFSYEVTLDQHLEMATTGDAGAMGDDEIPGEAIIDISGVATFTHTITEAAEAGSYEVNVRGTFDDLTVTGSVDGVPVDEVPDFAGIEPVDVTFLVDEKGNVIIDDEMFEDPFGGALGDLGSLGSGAAPGLDPGQFVGPPFPDEEIGVGDTWSEDIETPLLGDDPVVTSMTSTVTGTDTIDGFDVYVIETTTTSTPIEIDLGEFFIGLFTAFMPENPSEEEQAQLDAILGELRFVIAVDETSANATTLFDPEAGVARSSDVDSSAKITMDLNIPDESTGDLIGFQMEMSIAQQIGYRLLESG